LGITWLIRADKTDDLKPSEEKKSAERNKRQKFDGAALPITGAA
jgi:hypothetical protein